MTADTRSDRDLSVLLENLYLGPAPDYRAQALAAATRSRQRPAWTFAGRWLPVADVAAPGSAIAARVPWPALALALLVILLVAAGVAAFAGSGQPRVPPPFGLARNGLIAYAKGGDIFTIDPVSGKTDAVVTGPESDREPEFSPDGTRIAFRRAVSGAGESIVVAQADGSGMTTISLDPVAGGFLRLEWSPDSRSILATTAAPPTRVVLYSATAASSPRVLIEGAEAYRRPFRPPTGSEVLVNRPTAGGDGELLAIDVASGHARPVVTAVGGATNEARWSPDGTEIVYDADSASDPASHRQHVVKADGTHSRQVTTSAGTWYEVARAWSPDGTQVAFTRWRADRGFEVSPTSLLSLVDDSVRDIGPRASEVRRRGPTDDASRAAPNEGFSVEWSPDGGSLVAVPTDASTHPILIDLGGGSWRMLDPVVDADPFTQAWQRTAP